MASLQHRSLGARRLTNIPADYGKEAGQTDVMFNLVTGKLHVVLPADFSVSATTTSPVFVAFGVLLAQPGINGSFQFTYDGPTRTIQNVVFTHGANLLSGSFDNAFISSTADCSLIR